MGQPDVEDRTAPLLAHDPHGFRYRRLDLLRPLDLAGMGAARCRGDAGVVGRRVEGDADLVRTGSEAAGVNGERA